MDMAEDAVVVPGTNMRSFAGIAVYQAKKSCRSAGLKPSQASPAQMRMSASAGMVSRRYNLFRFDQMEESVDNVCNRHIGGVIKEQR